MLSMVEQMHRLACPLCGMEVDLGLSWMEKAVAKWDIKAAVVNGFGFVLVTTLACAVANDWITILQLPFSPVGFRSLIPRVVTT